MKLIMRSELPAAAAAAAGVSAGMMVDNRLSSSSIDDGPIDLRLSRIISSVSKTSSSSISEQ